MLTLIEVTCKNKAEAVKIAQALLKKKLIACANLGPVESYYWWQNKIVADKEVMLSCKTTTRNLAKTKQLIVQLHSYEIPVIIIKKVDTNKTALNWAIQVTKN